MPHLLKVFSHPSSDWNLVVSGRDAESGSGLQSNCTPLGVCGLLIINRGIKDYYC